MNAVVQQLLAVALGRLGAILAQLFSSLVAQGDFEKALTLAELHVANYAGSTAPNEEKRRMVAESLKADLARDGVQLRDSLVNLAIELAVAGAKAELAQVAAGAGA